MTRLRGVIAIDASRRGFSFIEMVIVVLIIGIMSALTMPKFTQGRLQLQLDLAARRMAADIMAARARSQAASRQQTVVFDATGYEIVGMPHPDRPADPYRVSLGQQPYHVSKVSADFGGTSVLAYDGYGVPHPAGTVTIELGTMGRVLAVDGETGLVTIAPKAP
jgi:prepilin-type N-terminal cleavage/methylation domain-containing protein